MNALSVYNVSKSVKDENLFSNVSFGLDAGEHIGIIGKNGTGKTTFLKLIAGQLEPDEGSITKNNSCRLAFLEQDVRYPEDCDLSGFLRLSDDEHVKRQYDGARQKTRRRTVQLAAAELFAVTRVIHLANGAPAG